MGKKQFTDEQKREALAAAEDYIRKGWDMKSIHRQLEADFQAEGKEMISWWTFYPLAVQLRKELQEESANLTLTNTDEHGQTRTNAGTEAETREADESADEELAAEDVLADDYTARLAMIVRLYRFRTEADVDAVCDRLIPELTEVRQ